MKSKVTTALNCLIVDDDQDTGEFLGDSFYKAAGITSLYASNNKEAFTHLSKISTNSGQLDFIITEIVRSYYIQEQDLLIDYIRSMSDDVTVNNGFKLKHIPIIIYTGFGNFEGLRKYISKYQFVQLLSKPEEIDDILQVIGKLIGEYRQQILADLQKVGFCLFWEKGRYRVGTAYSLPARFESEFFITNEPSIGEFYSRLVLVTDKGRIAQSALDVFEGMLNEPKTTERDLQIFFKNHPEFLLRDRYDNYWSEPRIKDAAGSNMIIPDFVLQPFAHRYLPWEWELLDLKSPHVPLFSYSRFHMGFSNHVHRLINQLQNYANFFADPRNYDILRKRFGGVVPQPKLVGIIGRLPLDNRDRYGVLNSRLNGISITTYDELLEFRRCKVERLKSYGL